MSMLNSLFVPKDPFWTFKIFADPCRLIDFDKNVTTEKSVIIVNEILFYSPLQKLVEKRQDMCSMCCLVIMETVYLQACWDILGLLQVGPTGKAGKCI
jgi:hypothetical protein